LVTSSLPAAAARALHHAGERVDAIAVDQDVEAAHVVAGILELVVSEP